MILMRFLPAVLKEFIKHVPTVLFEVMDWSDLASELPKLSKKILQKEGHAELLNSQSEYLQGIGIKLVTEPVDHHLTKPTKDMAEIFLKLYFAQLYSPHGIFVDIRAIHFKPKSDTLLWNPSSFWVKFDQKFQSGLLDIYQGFYFEDEDKYFRGLIAAGLMSHNWEKKDQQKLAQLFKEQFGLSLTSEIKFSLNGFKDSMMKIADFLLEKKVKISKDFLYLGLYLIALYSVLEECEDAIAVKRIFIEMNYKLNKP